MSKIESHPLSSSAIFNPSITFNVKVGTIINVLPTQYMGHYILKVNFGSVFGIKTTLLKTAPYILPKSLRDTRVCGIIDFPYYQKGIKKINTILLCMPDQQGFYIPIQPDYCIPNGGSIIQ